MRGWGTGAQKGGTLRLSLQEAGLGDGRDGALAHSPCTLPQVPHRLLTLTLLPGLELCLLCGPRPPLSQLDPQVNSGCHAIPITSSTCEPWPFSYHPALRVLSLLWIHPSWTALQSPSPQLGPFLVLIYSFQASPHPLLMATPPSHTSPMGPTSH